MIKVKKYRATNVADALRLIKADLGPDAIILESQKVRQPGLRGLFAAPVLEVSAVAEPAQRDFRLNPLKGAEPSLAGGRLPSLTEPDAPATTVQLSSFGTSPSHPVAAAGRSEGTEDEVTRLSRMVLGMQEQLERLNGSREAASATHVARPTGRTPTALEQPPAGPVITRPVWPVVTREGEPVAEQPQSESPKADPAPLTVGHLRTHLRLQEVADDVIDTWFGLAGINGVADAGLAGDALVEAIAEIVAGTARTTGPLTPAAGSCEVIVLVGSTGVGKTTTLAKLASLHAGSRRVAFVTAGQSGFVSTAQLSAHASMVGATFHAFKTVDELRAWVDAARHQFGMIFIDTPGICVSREDQIRDLGHMLDAIGDCRVLLVASASTKASLTHKAVLSFGKRLDGLLFTRLDEVDTCGDIVTLAARTELPVAYLAGGQNLRRGLEVASGERLAELILRGVATEAAHVG